MKKNCYANLFLREVSLSALRNLPFPFNSVAWLLMAARAKSQLKNCTVCYSRFSLVPVPGLVSRLRTHAQLMLSSIPLTFPLSFILQLLVRSQFPASCVSACVPRTYTILATRMGLHICSCDLLVVCARMQSSYSLLYPCLFPLSLILQLHVQSQFPASCVSVCVPRTYTIKTLP